MAKISESIFPVTRAPWELKDGTIIELIRPEEFATLPDGTVLRSIRGETKVKGTDYCDNDTRGGFLAFGFVRDDQTNRNLGAY